MNDWERKKNRLKFNTNIRTHKIINWHTFPSISQSGQNFTFSTSTFSFTFNVSSPDFNSMLFCALNFGVFPTLQSQDEKFSRSSLSPGNHFSVGLINWNPLCCITWSRPPSQSFSAGVLRNSYPIAVSNCWTVTFLFTSARFFMGDFTDAVALLIISACKSEKRGKKYRTCEYWVANTSAETGRQLQYKIQMRNSYFV